jgi:flagellar biosynthetic protein FliO
MKPCNPKTSFFSIVAMTLLVGLCVLAQSKETSPRVLIAETSSPASKNEAKSTKPKTESAAKPKTDSQAAPKPSPAPPLASVPEAPPKEVKQAKEERLPFKLNDRTELASEAPSAGGLLWRTFGVLLLIVGFIAAAGWALRYFGLLNFGKQQSEVAGLKVLDTVPLGERRTLTLVKFGERTLLIGATPQGLTLLAEQNDEPETPANYVPTMRTVTDLLDVNGQPPFEQEFARASLVKQTWSDRRVQ